MMASKQMSRRKPAQQPQKQMRRIVGGSGGGGIGGNGGMSSAVMLRPCFIKAIVAMFAAYCLLVVPYILIRNFAAQQEADADNNGHNHLLPTVKPRTIFDERKFPSKSAHDMWKFVVPPSANETTRMKTATAEEDQSDAEDRVVNANGNENGDHPANAEKASSCDFRKYPRRRYYGLEGDDEMPDFLRDAEYIYGELPTLLQPESDASKLCVDQSEWFQPQGITNDDAFELPFADGTNPSIISLHNPTTRQRLDPSLLEFFPPNVKYIASICMTDSQCAWKDTPEEQAEFHSSKQTKPTTVRTVLMLLDESFRTVNEATIYTEMDAPFGRKFKKPLLRRDDNDTTSSKYEMKAFALDDARLFTNRGQLWVSFREGKGFGYDKQVLNRLHISTTDQTKSLKVQTKASETVTFCCGRNMALIDNIHTNKLQSLTWVDPVTVITVDDGQGDRPGSAASNLSQESLQVRRRLLQDEVDMDKNRMQQRGHSDVPLAFSNSNNVHRRLGEQSKKSEFHGTNGMMVYLPADDEYLGMGHFHRPPGRAANEYARFGHHYTHSFFTVSARPPHHLRRLSAEFVLPSHAYPKDAEVIQFMSGLELVDKDRLVIAYGINDCEGAAVYVSVEQVESMLRAVPQGKEVVDLMRPALENGLQN